MSNPEKFGRLVFVHDNESGAGFITDYAGYIVATVEAVPILLGHQEKLGTSHWSDKPGESYIELTPQEQKELAMRLVQCVNACKDIADPENFVARLKKLNDRVPQMEAHIADLMTEREDLRSELRALKEGLAPESTARTEPAPTSQIDDSTILMICDAYEAGVGQGAQAKRRGVEVECPYGDEVSASSWLKGYAQGKKLTPDPEKAAA